MNDINKNPSNILNHEEYFKNPMKLMNFLPIINNKEENLKKNNFQNFIELSEKEKLIGNDFYNKKEFEKALIHYNKAIGLNPNNIIFYNNKTTTLISLNRISEAFLTINLGIEIGIKNNCSNENLSKSFFKLGIIQSLQNNFKESLISFKKSYELKNEKITLKKIEELEKKKF